MPPNCFFCHEIIAPQRQKRCCRQPAAAQRRQRQDEQSRQAAEEAADGLLVGRCGKSMGEAGVLRQRERRHGKARQRPLQHQRQRPAQARPGREPHTAAEAEVSHKVAAQPDDSEGPTVGVFQDLKLFFAVAVAREGVRGVGIAVEMDAAGDGHRHEAERRRPGQLRQGQDAAEAPQPAAHQPDEGEGAHGVPHIFLVPLELRHRQGRKHRKGHRDGLQNSHSFSPPL